jgi:hypothetical protein
VLREAPQDLTTVTHTQAALHTCKARGSSLCGSVCAGQRWLVLFFPLCPHVLPALYVRRPQLAPVVKGWSRALPGSLVPFVTQSFLVASSHPSLHPGQWLSPTSVFLKRKKA